MGTVGEKEGPSKGEGGAVVEFEVRMKWEAHEGDQDNVRKFPDFAEVVDCKN